MFGTAPLPMMWALCAAASAYAPATRVAVPAYPCPSLPPTLVVEAQITALQDGDAARAFRFASPEGKRDTGVLRTYEGTESLYCGAYYSPPDYRSLRPYEPVVRCVQFEIIDSVELPATAWSLEERMVRVRVWPSGVFRSVIAGRSFSVGREPLDFNWFCALQPEVRPACYEDDPMQAGVAFGPPGAGCWLVDRVRRCKGGGGGGVDCDRNGPCGGGTEAADESYCCVE